MDGAAVPGTTAPPSISTPATGEQAFEDWVAPHLTAMRRLALRLAPREYDDVLQESLVRAWRSFGRFDTRRGTPQAWLLTIVANRARSSRVLHPEPCELPTDLRTDDVHADTDLERAIARLARRQRTAVTLHYLLGLTVADVAEVMGCSTGTVKSTLSDARARLRKLLKETP